MSPSKSTVRWLFLLAALGGAACRSHAPAPETDAGGGRACGSPGLACGVGEYCSFTPNLCGKGKRPGTCRPRPVDCHEAYAPVCGCDGKIAASECEAHAAGIDLDVTGGCRTGVPGWIACGPRLCDARQSYCEIVLSDVFELPTDYTCRPLPATCVPDGDVARPCDCFPAGTRCGSFCGHLPTGGPAGGPAGGIEGFHLTCRL